MPLRRAPIANAPPAVDSSDGPTRSSTAEADDFATKADPSGLGQPLPQRKALHPLNTARNGEVGRTLPACFARGERQRRATGERGEIQRQDSPDTGRVSAPLAEIVPGGSVPGTDIAHGRHAQIPIACEVRRTAHRSGGTLINRNDVDDRPLHARSKLRPQVDCDNAAGPGQRQVMDQRTPSGTPRGCHGLRPSRRARKGCP